VTNISENLRGVLLMNLAMLVFTLNDTCMKAVTQTMPLFQAISLRGCLATMGLVMLALATRQLHLWPGRRDRAVITVRCVAEVLATVFFLAALMHMPLANLSAIMQSLPLAVTLAAALVFGDRIGWRRMTAILIGFVGVLIIVRPGPDGFDIWSIMGLGSVVAVVIRDLAARSLSPGIPSMTVAVWASASVTLMGFVGVNFEGWHAISGREALLLAIAAANLIVGYQTVVMVMRTGDIGFVAPFRYMSLIWAILLGWFIFGTLPDLLTLIGAGIVIATGLFTLYRQQKLAQISKQAVEGPA
jgi:drug/metabolite transporter (DMT)-like permease